MPAGAPKEVLTAGRTLIILGALTVVAGLGLLAAYGSGALQDRYDVADWFPIVAVMSAGVGGLAIGAGIGVQRLNPTWRVVGIVVGVLGVIGMLINLFSGNFLSLIIMIFWGRVVYNLVNRGDAFKRPSPYPGHPG